MDYLKPFMTKFYFICKHLLFYFKKLRDKFHTLKEMTTLVS